jgi:hypothetical protein
LRLFTFPSLCRYCSGWEQQSNVNFFVVTDVVMIAAGYAATLSAAPPAARAAAEALSCFAFALTILGWIRMGRVVCSFA